VATDISVGQGLLFYFYYMVERTSENLVAAPINDFLFLCKLYSPLKHDLITLAFLMQQIFQVNGALFTTISDSTNLANKEKLLILLSRVVDP